VPVQINGRTIREALWGEESYGLLLILLLIDYLVVTLDISTRFGPLVRAVTVSLTVLFAIHTSGGSRRLVRFAQFGVIIGLVGTVALIGWNNYRLAAAAYFVITILLVITPVVILERVLTKDQVDTETIFAAVDIYILLGLVFATLYIGMAKLMTNPPFLAQHGPHTSADYVYLSFVTLTTVGFGDLTPLSKVARSIVVLEALIGQIFLVVLVARLVSAYTSKPQTQKFLTRTPSATRRGRRRRNGGTTTADDTAENMADDDSDELGDDDSTAPAAHDETDPGEDAANAGSSTDEDHSGPSLPQ
jgi:hypothetical protein